MDVSVILTLIQCLIQLLDSPIGEEIGSLWGYKSQLEKLKDTLSTIRAVLLDADKLEREQLELSHVLQDKLQRLKEVVYQADDLLDEVSTIAQRKKLMRGNKMSKEVGHFFSRFNQFYSAFNMSREIRKIRMILDDIAKDHHDFGSRQHWGVEVSQVTHERDTHSFVHEGDDILGRDDDKRKVIDMLLDNSTTEYISFVTIVGMGGLGKTTLAQLVYNDERVEREFPLKMWVCVSIDFHTKLLRKILTSVTNQTEHYGLEMEQLQRKLRQELEGKKYLLVLDDVWDEDFDKWSKLKILLMGGGRGSRIIVTTRSKIVAHVVGNRYTYELSGLSEKDSWNLFKRMTLESREHEMEPYLIKTGKEIVRKCADVPLAIRVVGSLLRGQGKTRWQYLKNTDLADIKQDENDIVRTLKMSYSYLPLHLKSCFSFCAIFPKHYRIKKEELISLWMALGFIMPSNGESPEVVGEDYFMTLLQRCFFQDVERADSGEILSCKMHSLIHDLATEIAGQEVLRFKNDSSCSYTKTRHLFVDRTLKRKDSRRNLTLMKRVRTMLMMSYPAPLETLDMLLPTMRYLRVLDLHKSSFDKFPSMIGRLLHLRYLDLSWNHKLSVLPSCITDLYNLQTLMLRGCTRLEELPRDFWKLVNLRCLDIFDCTSMTYMPPGMNSMIRLHKLTMFLVGGRSNAGGLNDLKCLNNLSGSLEIKVHEDLVHDATEAMLGGYLINKLNLRSINICWAQKHRRTGNSSYIEDDSKGTNAEELLRGMQPHSNLRKLGLMDYPGVKFPRWRSLSTNLKTCLPNLVDIELDGCKGLEHLPLLSRLRCLNGLRLVGLKKLEYVESCSSGDSTPPASVMLTRLALDDEPVFFPSLEKLVLGCMNELKGWRAETGNEYTIERMPSFPRLSYLHIWSCRNLTAIPLCPKLEKLELNRFNVAMSPMARQEIERNRVTDYVPDDGSSTSITRRWEQGQHQHISGGLKEVKIDKLGYLNSLPLDSFQFLSHLMIRGDHDMERLTIGEVGKVFRSHRLSSLRSLVISDCSKLKTLSGRGVWENFTALESLQLKLLCELELDDNADTDGGVPWKYLHNSLHSLLLWYLPKLVKLPKGMHHLTALQSLRISNCESFEALPPWIACLSSLESLVITNCRKLISLPEEMHHLTSLQHLDVQECASELKERCSESTGVDWPKIQHIPRIDV
ncbi:putative disease resistance protein RGA1 [Amaranthus tricolor]|uniref:putative disease resistance protein RGA1 n=1 Tax=Amaranthus tricolor TaxID=29722 RepID=UPI002588E6DF|nr:putative disease resistance protein RGA1 [Amaranthus tricolor]